MKVPWLLESAELPHHARTKAYHSGSGPKPAVSKCSNSRRYGLILKYNIHDRCCQRAGASKGLIFHSRLKIEGGENDAPIPVHRFRHHDGCCSGRRPDESCRSETRTSPPDAVHVPL